MKHVYVMTVANEVGVKTTIYSTPELAKVAALREAQVFDFDIKAQITRWDGTVALKPIVLGYAWVLEIVPHVLDPVSAA